MLAHAGHCGNSLFHLISGIWYIDTAACCPILPCILVPLYRAFATSIVVAVGTSSTIIKNELTGIRLLMLDKTADSLIVAQYLSWNSCNFCRVYDFGFALIFIHSSENSSEDNNIIFLPGQCGITSPTVVSCIKFNTCATCLCMNSYMLSVVHCQTSKQDS